MPPTQLHIGVLVGDSEGSRVASSIRGAHVTQLSSALTPKPADLALLTSGGRGAALLVALRAARPHLPIIALVPPSDPKSALEAIRAGATEVVALDAAPQALQRAVEHAIARAARAVEDAAPVDPPSSPLVGASPAVATIRDQIQLVGSVDAPTVLITGESGVGKDVVANALHAAGPRRNQPFMAIDCAAIPDALLESHLFGHERGAFTDARQLKRGLFELAGAGTLFLDEIGELPLGIQAKLLRALESRRFRRVGGERDLPLEAAIIAATNRDLLGEVRHGSFRPDLYYRLNVVRIHVPPLRERPQDVAPLTDHFIIRFNKRLGREYDGPDVFALRAMQLYRWPGNVRELRNAIERAMILNPRERVIRVCDLPPEVLEPLSTDAPQLHELPHSGGAAEWARAAHPGPQPPHAIDGVPPAPQTSDPRSPPREAPTAASLSELERRAVESALLQAAGNQTRAAALLGISRFALRSRLRNLGLEHLARNRPGRPPSRPAQDQPRR